ncbi:unnamed protein product [Rhodiola kirilowii]
MATESSSNPPPPTDGASTSLSAEEMAAKNAQKRYDGLMMVRHKAVKGKGAWYWAHLEPILVQNNESGLAKAVKLRCSLCEAVFSASNPSRTASEHLKRGTCPNFNSVPKPISSIPPPPHPAAANRKRKSSGASLAEGNNLRPSTSGFLSPTGHIQHLAAVDPAAYGGEMVVYPPAAGGGLFLSPHNHHQPQQQKQQQQHLGLSGGKEDLGPLAMLEDRVRELRPKTSPRPTLTKAQIAAAMDNLTDWVYESCGSVLISSLAHPKFQSFLSQVGLPAISRREIAGVRLESKFEEVKVKSEERIREAMFFQIVSNGWKGKSFGEEDLVSFMVNLPNGTNVFNRAVFVWSPVPSNYAEEVMWETSSRICGNASSRCIGIVADKFKDKALKNLEEEHQWMVNLSCQYQGVLSLIKDFNKEHPLFKRAAENCVKLACFVNEKPLIRMSFHKYQRQEYGQVSLLRVPLRVENAKPDFKGVFRMVEDVLRSAQALQLILLDEAYEVASMEDPVAREVGEMIRDMGFWNELEAAHSLTTLIKGKAREIEEERPLVGRCLPLWDELRAKVKEWCAKYGVAEGPVEVVIEKRFRKNYHPAWAASFILDPLYLIRDGSGKYLPPFKCLTAEQEKDVDRLIKRLVPRDEAHIALMELMKWRTEGLDPVYARAVQMKERDPITGKMKLANPQSSRLVWETHLTESQALGKVAVRLIFLHATSCGFKFSWSFLRWMCTHGRSKMGIERAQKLIFVAANNKLERRDFSNDEDNDGELFQLANDESTVRVLGIIADAP